MSPKCKTRGIVARFTITNHFQMFSILNEISDNSPFRTTSVVTASIGTAGSIYILVAITGYLSFGDNVVGNIVSQCKSGKEVNEVHG